MNKYSSPQIEEILKTFGLQHIKVSSQKKKIWKAPQNWSQAFKLQDIEVQQNSTRLYKVNITFRDQSGLQRHKKINADPKANVLKDLTEDKVLHILDKIQNVSIFSQSFWQIWFAAFGQLKSNLVVAILKDIIGIKFSLTDLAQFSRQYSQQALQAVKQSPAMAKMLKVFKIREISVANYHQKKKSWAIPKVWKQQFILHNIPILQQVQQDKAFVKLQFNVPGSITRSKIIKFNPNAQFQQNLSATLQKLRKVKGRNLFSQIFWQIWFFFVEHEPKKARCLLKSQLGLPLSQTQQLILGDFPNQQIIQEDDSYQSSFVQSQQTPKSLSQNLKKIRKIAGSKKPTIDQDI